MGCGRKEYEKIKERNGYKEFILALAKGDGSFWTYDDDANKLANEVSGDYGFNGFGQPHFHFDEEDLRGKYKLVKLSGDAHKVVDISTTRVSAKATLALPSSALLKVDLLSDDEERTVIIVTNKNEQDSSKGIYGDWRGLSQTILSTLDEKNDMFAFKETTYLITSVYFTPKYKDLLTHRYHFLDPESDAQTLYVYKNKSYTSENGLEPVTAQFFYPGSPTPREMTVYYSAKKNKYFINQEEYNLFSRNYGLPYVSLAPAEGEPFPTNPDMAEESILHLYGYNVSSGLTDYERQNVLARLMDYGIVSKGKIEDHLSFLIFLGEKNYQMVNAVEAWKRDLRFANTYRLTDQRTIWIKNIKHKR